MRLFAIIFKAIVIIIFTTGTGIGLPTVEGKVFGLYPITNEVSFFKNVDDSGNNRGLTLQIVAINSFKIWTDFTFEFTGDFNWDMAYELDMSKMSDDHYIELSLVKPVVGRFSVNYQRILSTFEDESVNQFGIRLSF